MTLEPGYGHPVVAVNGPPYTAATGAPPVSADYPPWHELAGGNFFSTFYVIEWEAGAVIVTYPVGGDPAYQWGFPVDGETAPTWDDWYAGAEFGIALVSGLVTEDATNLVFAAAGTGVIAIVNYTGIGAVDPTIDPVDFFPAEVTVVAPYTFPSGTPGASLPAPDEAYAIDVTDLAYPVLYGPKNGDDWGAATPIVGADGPAPVQVTANTDTGNGGHIFTGSVDPTLSYAANNGDLWFDGSTWRQLVAGVWTP